MSKSNNVKIVVFVPISHADVVREAMGKAGAGKIGNYTFCSFSSRGTGMFKPEEGASPAIGKIGTIESVEEERIEAVCSRDNLAKVISAIKKVHPYEEVALDVYPLEDL
ncbi:MAG TPA: YqfO family protein [Patescibacteria group bacterium]|nr:YqfO family protein [Patescibacteria group bacterium]